LIDGPAAAIEWGATAGLHAFQKKSPRGIRTAQHDVDPVSDRLKVARRERQTKVRLAFAIDGIPEQRHLNVGRSGTETRRQPAEDFSVVELPARRLLRRANDTGGWMKFAALRAPAHIRDMGLLATARNDIIRARPLDAFPSAGQPFSTRTFISEYAVSISRLSAAVLAAVPGLSFTWRMNLPVPCNRRAGSGNAAP